jgi:hypothetical protein
LKKRYNSNRQEKQSPERTSTVKTYKWDQLSKKQQDTARRIAEQTGQQVTASQAAKYLDYIFAVKRGEISAVEFTKQTGIAANLIVEA